MAKWKDVSRTMTESAGIAKNFVQFVTKQVPVEKTPKASSFGSSSAGRRKRARGRGQLAAVRRPGRIGGGASGSS